MAYVRKTSSMAELSAIRRANALKGVETRRKNKTNNGGRPRGVKGADTDPTTSCTVHTLDSRFIDRMAFTLGISKAACIRTMILQYRSLHKIVLGNEDETRLNRSMDDYGKFVKQ